MLRNCKLVNWGRIVMLWYLVGSVILPTKLFAKETFSAKYRIFSASEDYSSEVEKQIRAGLTSTAALIVDYHPRLWMRGNWDWDAHNEEGSFAWRIVHGEPMAKRDPANDQAKYEFCYVAWIGDNDAFGETGYSTFGRRHLWTIVAAEARKRLNEWNLPNDLPGTSFYPDYDLQHTEDQLLSDARAKLLACAEEGKDDYNHVGATGILSASVGYDWLVNRKYSDGTPVLSDADRMELQGKLINVAESMRSEALGKGNFFNGAYIAKYCYFIAGLALYEPSGQGISQEYNAKAKQYLDEFDEYWVGKILPVLNEQGGTGGWHSGLSPIDGQYFNESSYEEVWLYRVAPYLFAHYTATGQSFENSVYNTGALQYAIEFENHMIYPNYEIAIGRDSENRYQWIAPLFVTSRRRFSSDPVQQWLGELAGWVRNERVYESVVDAGSYDTFDQLMWEEKWPNPRSAEELGCGTRHFAKLGWVAMRSGFASTNDLAALFICQRYHWSDLDLYAQNSFHIMFGDWLIKGNENTIFIDDQNQRRISNFPTIAEGVEAFVPGSNYDVGPGIQAFESNDNYDYIFGDATNAYDKNKLEKFTRGLVWIKVNNCFIIFDRVITKDAGMKKTWVIEPGSSPTTEGDRIVKITNGQGALWVKRLLPDQASETMSGSKFQVVSNQSVKEDYFLYVMQAADASLTKNSPKVVADEAQLITIEDQIGVKVDGWKILFDKTGSSEISVDYTNVNYKSKKELKYRLYQNYPNPFNPSTEIKYSLPEKSNVKLEIYNVLGQKIKTLVNSIEEAKMKSVNWNGLDDNGRNVASGVYLCRLETDKFISVKKMMYLQ